MKYLYFRTVSFGTLSVVGRVGAMIGPQLVYLVSEIQTCNGLNLLYVFKTININGDILN